MSLGKKTWELTAFCIFFFELLTTGDKKLIDDNVNTCTFNPVKTKLMFK